MKPLECLSWSGQVRRLGPPACSILALGLMLAPLLHQRADAATNTVTTLAGTGAGSLSDVIANSAPGDTVVFAVTGTIPAAEMLIAKDLSILGPGASALTISGSGGRLFNISANTTVLLSDVTISNGRTPNGLAGTASSDGGSSDPGGALLNSGSLTLWNCHIVSNATGNGGDGFSPPIPPYPPHTPPTAGGSAGGGGAIYNSGTLSASNCLFASNTTGRGGARAHNDTYWSGSGAAGCGGAIYNTGTLRLHNSTFSGNTTGGADGNGAPGGGVWNSGTLVANRCVFSGNVTAGGGDVGGASGGNGGAIFSQGLLALTNCTVTNNTCGSGGYGVYNIFPGNGGSGGAGGGLYAASAVLNGCTVVSNRAGAGGAGGYTWAPYYPGGSGGPGGEGGGIRCNGTFFILTNCTVAGNNSGGGGPGGSSTSGAGGGGGAGGPGGGICFGGNTQTVVACTIAQNNAGGGGPAGGGPAQPGAGGSGGGVYTWAGLTPRGGGFLDTIVALNTGQGPDLSGIFISFGYNLIGITNGSAGFGSAGDLLGSSGSPLDPKLGPLADYGGPTLTISLLPGSPALDAGGVLGAPPTDQRGVPRPQGMAVDIGAFEFQFPLLQIIGAKFQSSSQCWLQACGEPNQVYTLQTSANLVSWSVLTNFTTDSNGRCELVDSNAAAAGARFYRLCQATQ